MASSCDHNTVGGWNMCGTAQWVVRAHRPSPRSEPPHPYARPVAVVATA